MKAGNTYLNQKRKNNNAQLENLLYTTGLKQNKYSHIYKKEENKNENKTKSNLKKIHMDSNGNLIDENGNLIEDNIEEKKVLSFD